MRRLRFRSCLRGIAAVLLLGQVAAASAAGLRLYVWPTPPIYSGTSYSFGVSFEKQDRNDGIVHTAPFTFRTTLPAGVDYIGSQGSSWQCSAGGANLRDITCTYNTDLNFPMPQSSSLGINAMVVANVVPGPVNLVGTVQNAQVPLPPTPTCTASPSDSGCVTASTTYVSSRIAISGWGVSSGAVTAGPVAVWSGPPFEAGTQNVLILEMGNIGYGAVNTPVKLDLWLPTGFAYGGVLSGGIPGWSCASQATAGHVRCTTPSMYDTQTGFVSLRVNVANDVAVPGPLFVHAAISNNVQAVPADCVATPLQLGCARLQVPTRIPRVAVLVSDGISHSPQTYTLGREQGPLIVGYRNIGEAAASNSRIYIQLPPQIEFLSLYSSSPFATCTVQGALASGQIVTCSSTGLGAAPFHLGSLSLRVFAHAAAASPGPLNVLVAVEQAAAPNAALLQSCAANPAQSFCAVHTIATFFPCALQFGAEGIFCDGLQPFVRP